MAWTLRSRWYAMGSRWIGPGTQEASTTRRNATLSTRGEACGQAAMLSRGYSAPVSGKADGRVTVRTMRGRILRQSVSEKNDLRSLLTTPFGEAADALSGYDIRRTARHARSQDPFRTRFLSSM